MKRILLAVAAIAAVATAAVWFAAEESYVTTVKTRVGTGLNVSTHGSQNYGLVFGQEERIGSMLIEINDKAKADRNLTGINYFIACNDGASGPNASTICPNLVIAPFGLQKLVVGGQRSAGVGAPAVDTEGPGVGPLDRGPLREDSRAGRRVEGPGGEARGRFQRGGERSL